LGFLDEFVEKDEAVGEFRCPFCVFIYAGVDEFLDEAVLVAGVDAETGTVSLLISPLFLVFFSLGFVFSVEKNLVVLTRIVAMKGARMW